MRRWINRIATVVLVTAAIGLATAWWAVRQTHFVPEFYTRATESLPASTIEASRHLEAEVEQLQSDAAKIGSWQAVFSDDEINAWLIEQLPQKFPQLFAKGASEPRIVIEEGRVLAAVRYKDRRIDTVVSCQLEVELTEEPNMLALNVVQLRAGALPIPLSKFLQGISKEAAKGDIDIRWDETEAGPVALVTVPSEHPRYVSSPVIVESVQLIEGSLILSGHTGPLAHESYRPRGPVYRFVSYQPVENDNRKGSRLSSRRRSSSDKRLR
ncbi:MAG: hypothetical protein ACR2NZ_00275 [Rubripirellula sp.]